MIEFDKYYVIAAEEIVLIAVSETAGATHLYALSVTLKNGKTVTVNYVDKQARDKAKRDMAAQINRELSWGYERIRAEIGMVKYAVERIDKRQLRIWRILSKLLRLSGEEAEL